MVGVKGRLFDSTITFAGLPAIYRAPSGSTTLFFQAPIDAFQTRNISEDSTLKKQFLIAKDLLESFRLGTLKVDEVFDSEKLAMLFAVVDLFGYQHAMAYGNIRFYYNPVTSLLEPIGYDQQTLRDVRLSLLEGEEIDLSNRIFDVWIALFFQDNDFYARYIKALTRVSDPAYLDSFLKSVRPELDENKAILYRSFPAYTFDGDSILRGNQQYIRRALDPVRGVHAYFSEADAEGVTLQVGNIHSLPVEILHLAHLGSTFFSPEEHMILAPKELLKTPSYRSLRFQLPDGFAWTDSTARELTVAYRLPGTDSVRYDEVYPWRHVSAGFPGTDIMRQKPNVGEFTFLEIDERSGRILIRPGTWDVMRTVIIPAGRVLVCSGGTRIRLTRGAKILSYSPLQFRGTEDNPIYIESPDSTGQGIVVLKAGATSILEWVVFDNLSYPAQGGWEMTGAVTFYESPVELYDCQFSNSRSEDALNVIRGNMTMNRTVFKGNASDAFDGDFMTGVISNSSFLESGNDAVDISGSILNIHHLLIDGAGDKGLSIGEDSRAEISGVEIKRAEIAIAGKDFSHLQLRDATISQCAVGFTVFRKKPEFGGATVVVTGLTTDGVDVPYLVEEGSSLVVDGQRIESNQELVKDLLYGVKYGKTSK